jgi:hypothetical protein
MVDGGFMIANDVNFNILILDKECNLIQSLPYSRKVVDAIADSKHIFIAIE